MGAFSMAIPKKRPHHFTPIGQTGVHVHKVPRLCTLKLCYTTIWPHKMPFQCIPLFKNVLPMKFEAMLRKLWIMFVIVKNIKMIFNKDPCLFIIGIILRVMTKTNVYQYANLVKVPMHILYLIINFKRIFFGKVHNWHETLVWKSFQVILELFVFPHDKHYYKNGV